MMSKKLKRTNPKQFEILGLFTENQISPRITCLLLLLGSKYFLLKWKKWSLTRWVFKNRLSGHCKKLCIQFVRSFVTITNYLYFVILQVFQIQEVVCMSYWKDHFVKKKKKLYYCQFCIPATRIRKKQTNWQHFS